MTDTQTTNIIIVAENHRQRIALTDTVRVCGFNLVDCIAPDSIRDKHLNTPVDLWLIDSEEDYKLINQLNQNNDSDNNVVALIGFIQAPMMSQTYDYNKWQRSLIRKLSQLLNQPDMLSQFDIAPQPTKPWQYVVLIGASMGGPVAIKDFLDNLSPDLPISIIIAQHFDQSMLTTLPHIITRHNKWRAHVMNTTQSLHTGQCLIVPADRQVFCDSNGKVILQKQTWSGEYRPDISRIFLNASDVYANNLIGIIFSGMGDDGSHYLERIDANDSLIWAQTAESSICDSQPQAAIDTGFCHFIGTPIEMAEKLTRHVKYSVPKASAEASKT